VKTMSQLLGWLSGGDLRSDGLANEAAQFILQNPDLLGELLVGLNDPDDVIRGHAADSLEKVARIRPDLLAGHLSELISSAEGDCVAMVRWHIAMILGHLAGCEGVVNRATPVLLRLLEDPSVFVRSWAIVSLCILARRAPERRREILNAVARLQSDPSVAIRSKVRKAMNVLTDDRMPFPQGWVKSEAFKV
jgi:HEAT repeat protein